MTAPHRDDDVWDFGDTLLRDQLSDAREAVHKIDPVETEVGRRWIWLVTALVLVLGLLIAVAAQLGR